MLFKGSVSELKGVGTKTEKLLNKCNIYTIEDLLLYFPRDYQIIPEIKSYKDIVFDKKVIIYAKVKRIEKDYRTRTGKTISTIVFNFSSRNIKAKWFNQPFVKKQYEEDKCYFLICTFKMFNREIYMLNISKLQINALNGGLIVPVYSLTKGLNNNFIIKLLRQVLSSVNLIENIPCDIIRKYRLISLDKAIRYIHAPQNAVQVKEARRRLKFQELLTYSLKILLLKKLLKNNNGIPFKISPELKMFKESIPYELTNSQKKVIKEILIDEKRNSQMNRLVQGDVGSGKTIVAFVAIFNVVKNNYQAALLVPTEVLAKQHYSAAKRFYTPFNINVGLLTGSMSIKEKKNVKEKLKNGKIDVIIGTHALFEDNVEFSNLGLIVTDEQHRFGVLQRNKLYSKGKNADILVMTATPIPRTLSLYIYGDLNVSVIDELPPGRQKIDTLYYDMRNKDAAYKIALREVKAGRQVYIICPLIEKDEENDLVSVKQLYSSLKNKYFKNVPAEILYGSLPEKDKDNIMNKFANGEIKVLISTTVIEVGINVPNATVMIVENAERFGLAQLHQLRGRVGRGKFKSYCILLANIKSDFIRQRMEILKSSTDGFYIAEQDLKIRGTGEIFGVNQHGENDLIISDIIRDFNILKAAHGEALNILSSNDKVYLPLKNEIIKKINTKSNLICFN